mmetsp:Transcript_20073/g.62096  ORF Transcript_20073/g.62096 Transcript_20073/m.62096 type:complete len:146 (-) Transcript_20073:90-527(-)|eukprot:CAMPEP_0198669226 /NCGR_PEP_ID=MMETSP1467-20131203/75362_1 /TAXON_ID=1462469 /ORGANISM="unid. sp., Strain CCMP2135" /LENGTH=145 /DNA_ID=CAMNT_0044405971 /DNA_START=24 /DNA_END=461 /DNA_ORIENTATION=+
MTLEETRAKYPGAEAFKFGDSRELCERLTALVRAGKKTATCEALATYESGGEAMPEVGRRDIATDWDGRPAVVIETVALEIKRFCDVDASFALLEGENDDLEGWRHDHRRYFERSSAGFDSDMRLVCERFKVVEAFPPLGPIERR